VIGGVARISLVLPARPELLWFTAGMTSLIGALTLSACAALLANAGDADRQGRIIGNN
jgi:hypothetical protein